MPELHLHDLPNEVYTKLQQLAACHGRTPEAEAVTQLNKLLLSPPLACRPQEELLAELRRRSYTPPPGTPDSVTLLAEDRER
jgi:plasmid stability protein